VLGSESKTGDGKDGAKAKPERLFSASQAASSSSVTSAISFNSLAALFTSPRHRD
jgi:hypothetical protein